MVSIEIRPGFRIERLRRKERDKVVVRSSTRASPQSGRSRGRVRGMVRLRACGHGSLRARERRKKKKRGGGGIEKPRFNVSRRWRDRTESTSRLGPATTELGRSHLYTEGAGCADARAPRVPASQNGKGGSLKKTCPRRDIAINARGRVTRSPRDLGYLRGLVRVIGRRRGGCGGTDR